MAIGTFKYLFSPTLGLASNLFDIGTKPNIYTDVSYFTSVISCSSHDYIFVNRLEETKCGIENGSGRTFLSTVHCGG